MATDAPSPDQDREDVLGPGDLARPEVRRSLDPELGHDARSPTEIPRRAWWVVVKRVAAETVSDHMTTNAASCAFYAMLALFPAISVLISLYGLILDPLTVETQLHPLRDVLPPAAYDMVAQRVHDLAAKGNTALTWRAALGLLVALWSATAGTKALMMALNIAYEEKETRSFVRFNLVAIGLTLGGIVGVTLALSIIVGVPAALQLDELGPSTGLAVRVISFSLLLGFVVLGLAVLYRLCPAREEAKWRWVTPGSILAAVLWILVSLAFSFYVANFGSYDAAYGSLGAVVVVLLWFYLSAFVVMLGAELNAELELQTRRDTTTGPDRPMGKRGAYVADHVATA
jgi:membrane protein